MSGHLLGQHQRRSLQHATQPRYGGDSKMGSRTALSMPRRRQSVSDPTGRRSAASRRLETVMAYGAEFAAEIERQLSKLPPPQNLSSTGSGMMNRGSAQKLSRKSSPAAADEHAHKPVVLCAMLSELGSAEVMENLPLTSYARHPDLYTLHPSLDFRNAVRVEVQKHQFDFALDSNSEDKAEANCIRPLLAYNRQGAVTSILNLGKKSRDNLARTERILKFSLQELGSSCSKDWQLYISCLELLGGKVYDLLNMSEKVTSSSRLATSSASLSAVGKTGITEVALASLHRPEDFCSKVLKLRQSKSHSHFVCKVRLKHRTCPRIEDGAFFLADLAILDEDTPSEIRKDYMVLKESIRGRIKARQQPQLLHPQPYKATKLTQILSEAFNFDKGRQAEFLIISNIGATLLDGGLNEETIKFVESLKPPPVPVFDMSLDPENLCLWGVEETRQWIQLNSSLAKERIPAVACGVLLQLTQLQFVSLMQSTGSGASLEDLLDLHGLMWTEVGQLRIRDKERKAKGAEKGFVPKQSADWRLNGTFLDPEDIATVALEGASKKSFEAALNRGFEANKPRYDQRTQEMMQLEWIGKVRAADRAEAKLFPILSIDTKKYVGTRGRRSSIYE